MQCSDDIGTCSISGINANTIQGQLTCDTSGNDNNCYVDVGQNGGWSQDRVTLRCKSNTNHCDCQGDANICNTAVTIVTNEPTPAPSSIATTFEPTVSPNSFSASPTSGGGGSNIDNGGSTSGQCM